MLPIGPHHHLSMTSPVATHKELGTTSASLTHSPTTPRTRRLVTSPVSARQSPLIVQNSPNPPPAAQKYISHLQAQIHLLEVETKMLKEKVTAQAATKGVFSGGTDDQDTEVDPTMRDLRMMYMKLQQEMDDDRDV